MEESVREPSEIVNLQVVTFMNDSWTQQQLQESGWVQRGFYSAAVECVFDGVSFPSSSERNGYDVKGLSIVLQDVKCPFPVTWDLLLLPWRPSESEFNQDS